MSARRPTWGGRIAGGRDPAAQRFLDEDWDEGLIEEHDVVATIAHVHVLRDAGLLSATESKRLISALRRLEPLAGQPDAEDVHSATEQALTESLGAAGARVHAGRSRNDLVATDVRLYARERIVAMLTAVLDLRSVLLDRATEHAGTLVPGYTHLQRAQPITVGQWLLAYEQAFTRDTRRLFFAHETSDVSALGAGALAGNTLGLDPSVAAGALGFSAVFANSVDAVAARDFLLDASYACAATATDLSRLCEEIVVWSSAEFGFVRAADAHTTGSSMMPQKRNPDVAELSRAEAGAMAGVLVDLLVTIKSGGLAYNRDLQGTKRALRPLGRADRAITAVANMVRGLAFDEVRMRDALGDELLYATDVAEAIVSAGVPFRTAHEMVATVVREAEASGTALREAILANPAALSPLPAPDAIALLEPEGAVRRRTTPGGPSKASVGKQLRAARRSLAADRRLRDELAARLPTRSSAARP